MTTRKPHRCPDVASGTTAVPSDGPKVVRARRRPSEGQPGAKAATSKKQTLLCDLSRGGDGIGAALTATEIAAMNDDAAIRLLGGYAASLLRAVTGAPLIVRRGGFEVVSDVRPDVLAYAKHAEEAINGSIGIGVGVAYRPVSSWRSWSPAPGAWAATAPKGAN